MEKIIVIAVAATLSLLVISAITGKNLKQLFTDIKQKFSPIPENNNDSLPTPEHTIAPTLVNIYPINPDGTPRTPFSITEHNIYDDTGDMVGCFISHPVKSHSKLEADSNHLYLSAKTKNGKYDMNDPATYNAFTVNSDSVAIGEDADGLYGQVTNPKAKVYFVGKDRKKVRIKFEEQFPVEDDTYLLIANQWLYFKLPEDIPFKEIRYDDTADTNNGPTDITDEADDIPDFISGKKTSPVMKPRNKEAVPKTAGTNVSSKTTAEQESFRFPFRNI